MPIRHGLIALVVVALAAPTAARADEVVTAPTSTTATATASCSVGYTVTVVAEDGSVPEGTVELTADGTVLSESPLVDGRATWYANRSTVTPQQVTYVAADDRWAGSTSAVTYVDTGSSGCGMLVEAATVSVEVARVRVGKRAPISVSATWRGNVVVSGEVVVRVTGGRGFSWSRTRPIDSKLELKGPRMTRSGRYRVEVSFTSPFYEPETARSSFQVRSRHAR